MVAGLDAVEILGVLACLFAWSLSVLVLRVAPWRPVNRLLALILFLDGNLQLIAVTDPEFGWLSRAASALSAPAFGALPFLYLLLYAQLETPLVRWFRRPTVRRLLVGLTLAAQAVLLPIAVLLAFGRAVPFGLEFLPILCLLLLGLVFLFGLIVSISALRRSTSPAARSRARAFVRAFGARDGLFVAYILYAMVDPIRSIGATAWAPRFDAVMYLLPVIGGLLLPPLLTYGILRTQVLDIEVRLRKGLSRTTIGAAFLAVYVAVSQTVQTLVAPNLGVLVGLLAAGMLVFALTPIQRVAERLAARVLPVREPQEAFGLARRLGVYEAALEETIASGAPLGTSEGGILKRLREQLGLTDRDHLILENSLRARKSPSPVVAGHAWSAGEVVLGKYRVLARLGRGGFGDAYQAWDEDLDRPVVIKSVRGDGASVQTVLDEARSMAAIRSPHVLLVYDVARVGDTGYIIMEFAGGGTLKDRVAGRDVSQTEFHHIAIGILDALQAVHDRGLVHRDVKPSNVFFDDAGTPKLGDFGVAHWWGEDATQTGGLPSAGTPRYMSPEQARGRRPTPQSDLYSAAATLWEALTGRAPHGSTPEARDQASDPRAFDETLVPSELRPWFWTALQREPQHRFQSALEMAQALPSHPGPVVSDPPGKPRADLLIEKQQPRTSDADEVTRT